MRHWSLGERLLTVAHSATGFGSQGLRRRPVLSTDTSDIIGMVSQLDVIMWLSRHHNQLSPVLESISIEQVVDVLAIPCGGGGGGGGALYGKRFLTLLFLSRLQKEQRDPRFCKMRQVCNVMMDTLMLDVLRLLDQSKLNGISGGCNPHHLLISNSDTSHHQCVVFLRKVVNHTGKLVANISVSDLQYTVEKNLDNLFTTVEHFLERVPMCPLITCSPKASLASLPLLGKHILPR